MKDYSFNNVTVTVNAESPADAYKQLCEILGAPENVGYATDTYTDCETGEEREVSELFPGQWGKEGNQ